MVFRTDFAIAMMGDISQIALTASVWIIPVLIAVTLHEAAHGWAAWKLGDDTAKILGRVSFNPFRHVDRFGTIILPALLLIVRSPFLFGWAKPVPVNFRKLRDPRRGMVLVAAAGPGANFILAYGSALLLHGAAFLPDDVAPWVIANLVNSIKLNVILAVFNMLPLPPLDGGRVAVGLLPGYLARPLARLEKYGLFILIGLIFLLPMIGQEFGFDVNVFSWLVGGPVAYLTEAIAMAAGIR